MNYFSRFIPRFSDIAVILHEQTKKEAPPWSALLTDSWNMLKKLLSNATLMHHPNFALPFHVFSDASIRAIGGVLMQLHENSLRPIAYIARKMLPAEVNYNTTEQELLAIIFCFGQWRCYLEGSQVLLHTDHEPLTWVKNQIVAKPSRRISRWLEILSRFDYEIVYIRGDENLIADALTRMLTLPNISDVEFPDDWPRALALTRLFHHRWNSTNPDERSDRPDLGDIPEYSGGAEAGTGCLPTITRGENGCNQGSPSQRKARASEGTREYRVAAGGYTRSSQALRGGTIRGASSKVTGTGEQRGAGGESPDKSDSEPPRRPQRARQGKRGREGEAPLSDTLPVLDVSEIRAYKPMKFTTIRGNSNKPMSAKSHDNTNNERLPSQPDQREKDISLGGPDPSLAKFEVLISNLFDRIRDSLIGDEITQTLEKMLQSGRRRVSAGFAGDCKL